MMVCSLSLCFGTTMLLLRFITKVLLGFVASQKQEVKVGYSGMEGNCGRRELVETSYR